MSLSPEQLVGLYDKQCLHDNLMTYCRAVDRMDLELLRTTYWADSTDDHGSFVGGGQEWADAALGWKDACYSVNHHVSNVLSEVEGNRAKRESMFICVTAFKEPRVYMFQAGRYRDLCEKRNGAWKILNRVCVWDWCEEREVKNGWHLAQMPEQSNWGAFFPSDPIYKGWERPDPTTIPKHLAA